MAQSAKRFAELLQEGINAIADRTSKPKGVIRDELGYAIGRNGGSAIEYWAYGDGRIPSKQSEVAELARMLVDSGELDKSWLTAFLESAGYPDHARLVVALFPEAIDHALHNLPLAATPFVDREAELSELANLIVNPDCRLITLVGPGGSGKTRLAIEIARQTSPCFADGAVFVELAPLGATDLIASTVAASLNLSLDSHTTPQVQVLRYLRGQKLLLILDNIEHLLASPAQAPNETDENPVVTLVTEILQQASDVMLLVTSRERLNMQGEWVYDIGGLEMPTEEAVEDQPPLASSNTAGSNANGSNANGSNANGSNANRANSRFCTYSAPKLFVQTAQRVEKGFNPTKDEQAAILQICRLVEGMPLALELAATWVRALSCDEIVVQLEESLGFLTTTLRDIPPRHRSVLAVFDHSWELLSTEEQKVFARCSVFRGGFTREAATAISGATLQTLVALIDKSLLSRNQHGRYTVHELARQYAAHQLADAQVESETRNCHLTFFMRLAEEAEPKIRSGPQSAQWHDRVELEHDNLRAALEWSFGNGEFEPGYRIVAELWAFWMNRSHAREGQVQAERFLRRPEAASPTYLRAKALHTAGVCAFFRGRYTNALVWLQEGETISRQLGAEGKYPLAMALAGQGYTMVGLRKPDAVQTLSEEILALGHELEDDWARGHALQLLGIANQLSGDRKQACQCFLAAFRHFQADGGGVMRGSALMKLGEVLYEEGDYAAAQTYLTQSLTVYDELKDKQRGSIILMLLGYRALALGNLSEAEELLATALTYARQTGRTQGLLRTVDAIGRVAQQKGDYARAHALHGESLTLALEAELPAFIHSAIEAFACLAAAQGEAERAAVLFGAAETSELHRLLSDPHLRAEHDRLVACVRKELDEAAFANARDTGAEMSLEQVVDYALRSTDDVSRISALEPLPNTSAYGKVRKPS